MSNLGDYQRLTSLIKTLGGPARAKIVAAAVVGAVFVAGNLSGATLTTVAGRAKERLAGRGATRGGVFTIRVDCRDPQGLSLRAGQRFRVLSGDYDAILVELLGDPDNPYFLDATFLSSISDFKNEANGGST